MRNRNKCILYGLAGYVCMWAVFAVAFAVNWGWVALPVLFTLLIGTWVGLINCLILILDRRHDQDKW